MKKALLALMLVAALILSGCSLVTVDKEADNARVILNVNGETVTKADFLNQVDYTIYQNEQMNTYYSYFGMEAGLPTDEATVRESVKNSLINSLVLSQKLKNEGRVDALTEEDVAKAQENADADWQSLLDEIKSAFYADTELEGEALTAELEKYATETLSYTKEQFLDNAKLSVASEKLQAETVAGVTVDDEAVQARLDELAAADKESLDADPALYAQYVNGGADVYYVPAGYRMVKHILISLTDEEKDNIDTLNDALIDAQAALDAAQGSETVASEEVTIPAEEAPAADAEAVEQPAAEEPAADTEAAEEPAAEENVEEPAEGSIEALTKAVADAQAALDAAKETAYARALEDATKVYELAIAEGADFDALIAEYTGDTNAPADGYPVCEASDNYVPEFTEAALALANIGDISEPVKTEYGYHIMKYTADLQEGPVTLDSVYEKLHTDLLTEAQNAFYSEQVAQWVEAADVKTFMEKLDK